MELNVSNRNKYVELYSERYKEYGYDPKTLGWFKGKQDIRFDVLTSQVDLTGKKILDIGCGFGDLNICLTNKFGRYSYYGIDVVPVLIEEAQKKYVSTDDIPCKFYCDDFLKKDFQEKFDYAIASGIFNFKLEGQDNYEYVDAVIKKAFDLCSIGIAFDFLSDKVDFIKYGHTFHFAPDKILSMGYKYTRNVVFRNDCLPFEFAIFLFKDDSFDKETTIFNRYIEQRQK